MKKPDMIPAILPLFLQPRVLEGMTRIGRDHDGGYLVDNRNLNQADFLVGLGLSNDWSFERQFLSQNPVQFVGFDASIGFWRFLKEAINRVVMPQAPKNIAKGFWTVLDYPWFFRGPSRKHIKNFVGYDNGEELISLKTMFANYVPEDRKHIFFKIDIEGWEYRILDDLITYADRIEGMVIEFHDVDLHLDRIQAFIQAIPLGLCHVHANNFQRPPRGAISTVIECTFTRHELGDDVVDSLPTALDRKNSKRALDIAVDFVEISAIKT